MEGISFMKANAQRNFGLSAMLALAVASLSGCVTANTLEHARPFTEVRWTGTPVALADKGMSSRHTDNPAYDAQQLARLEAEGKIRLIDHTGKPGYYALVPLAVAADIALVPGYIIFAAMHLRNPN